MPKYCCTLELTFSSLEYSKYINSLMSYISCGTCKIENLVKDKYELTVVSKLYPSDSYFFYDLYTQLELLNQYLVSIGKEQIVFKNLEIREII